VYGQSVKRTSGKALLTTPPSRHQGWIFASYGELSPTLLPSLPLNVLNSTVPPPTPEERREGIVSAGLAQFVCRAQGGMALREGGVRDPGGLGGDRRERLRAQQHEPPGGGAAITLAAAYPALPHRAEQPGEFLP